jgi:glycosyltransferase involved in cell wall biosynthesis
MTLRAGWVAYVGPFLFPWGEAGSRRVYGIARSLAAAGYEVVVASGDAGPSTITRLDEVDGPGSVSYLGLGEMASARTGLLTDAKIFLRWGQKTVHWLDAQATKPSHVLVYGGEAQYMLHLQRWCRRNRVRLIADVADWSNGHYVRGGVLGPMHISMKMALRYHYPRCDGIIAVSSLLEGYYQSRGNRVLRIPPTLDVQNLAVRPRQVGTDSPDLALVYAGNPCRNKKDLLTNIIEAVDRVDREGASIKLRVYGPSSRKQVEDLLGGGPPPRSVRILGQLPQQDVPRALQEADFSILVRRPERYAHAGFSTKFCESLANGTPIIANLTSDIGSYLRHGTEGLVCRDHSVDGLAETFRAALHLSGTERTLMREAARRRALNSFDFRAYAEPLGEFVDAGR